MRVPKITFRSRPLAHAYAWAPIIAVTALLGAELISELFLFRSSSAVLSEFSKYVLAAVGVLMFLGGTLTLAAFFWERVRPTVRGHLEQVGTFMVAVAWFVIGWVLQVVAPGTYFFSILCWGVSAGAFNRVRQLRKDEANVEKELTDDATNNASRHS